jgi:asparagine synthetase B (glutamine-hydrolysing)
MPSAHDVLTGVFDPSRAFDEAGARAFLSATFKPGHPEVVFDGPLAVARTPGGGVGGRRRDPMTMCVLAGRVYNAGEIATASGLDPDEAAETVLATAYDRHGDDLLEGMFGSFVVVLWNPLRRQGVIAQDQLGTRSLYYHDDGSRLRFASDIGVLVRVLPRRPAPNATVVAHLLSSARGPVELTPYEGIWRAGAGQLIRLAEGRWRRERYWRPQYRRPASRSRADLSEELWVAVTSAVRARVDAGGSPGIIMSGGLDSALVAAAATPRGSGQAVPRTYSAVFPGQPSLDESPRVRLLADSLDLPGVEIEVHRQGALAASLEYLRAWDIPLSGPGLMLERPLVRRAAEDGVTALLDGQGGNELFDFSPYLASDRLRHGRLVSSIGLVRSFPLGSAKPPWRRSLTLWRRFALKGALPYGLQRRVRRRRGPERYVSAHLNDETCRLYFDAEDPLAWKRDAQGPLWWAWLVHMTTHGWEQAGLPEYLRHRAAMGGIEARPPLMDTRLVEAALSIPPQANFDPVFDRPLIRNGLKGRVPDDVRLWHEKSNLGPLYYDSMLADLAGIRSVLGPGAETRQYVRQEVVADLLANPPAARSRGYLEWMAAVWYLVVVECWLQQQSDPQFAERALEEGLFREPSSRLERNRSTSRNGG